MIIVCMLSVAYNRPRVKIMTLLNNYYYLNTVVGTIIWAIPLINEGTPLLRKIIASLGVFYLMMSMG